MFVVLFNYFRENKKCDFLIKIGHGKRLFLSEIFSILCCVN